MIGVGEWLNAKEQKY